MLVSKYTAESDLPEQRHQRPVGNCFAAVTTSDCETSILRPYICTGTPVNQYVVALTCDLRQDFAFSLHLAVLGGN